MIHACSVWLLVLIDQRIYDIEEREKDGSKEWKSFALTCAEIEAISKTTMYFKCTLGGTNVVIGGNMTSLGDGMCRF